MRQLRGNPGITCIYGKLVLSLENFGASFGIPALRISIGIIYLWFGVPKFFPGSSPAESLAADTVERLTFGIIEGVLASVLTGGLESILGIILISGKVPRPTILVLLGHMVGTCAPLFIFPEITWKGHGVGTLEGQYILKNMVIVAAAFVLIGHAKSRAGKSNSRVDEVPPLESPLLGVAAPLSRGSSQTDSQPRPAHARSAESRRRRDLRAAEK